MLFLYELGYTYRMGSSPAHPTFLFFFLFFLDEILRKKKNNCLTYLSLSLSLFSRIKEKKKNFFGGL